ncbi:hypothetical protein GCM10023165_30830 [Variovorax defluvii]|uniref:Pyrrolo-quinoline quinone repeat domain-containing protein n=1 Tax=Variovorax defluvii TaxID=913761 RepID=A0ABP8HWP6_9BURK
MEATVPGEINALQVTTIMIGDTLYACDGNTTCFDAETGQARWRRNVSDGQPPSGKPCRGVAYYKVPQAQGVCAERIFAPSHNPTLAALNARTGELCPGFGKAGLVTAGGYRTLSARPVLRQLGAASHPRQGGGRRGHPGRPVLGRPVRRYPRLRRGDRRTGLGLRRRRARSDRRPTKRGEIFALDRQTGEPIKTVRELPVPQQGIAAGERLSPTQPESSDLPAFRGAPLREKDMRGMTPLDQLYCRIEFKRSRYEGMFTPVTLGKTIVIDPGSMGGVKLERRVVGRRPRHHDRQLDASA